MWEIFTFGQIPWRGITAKDIVRGIETGTRLEEPANIPASFWNFTIQTWLLSPTERPNFKDLVAGLLNAMPREAKSTHDCTQSNRLNIRRGNTVYIIKENEIGYLAQSASSLEIGAISKQSTDYSGPEYLTPISPGHQRVAKNDISKPVENSFIHAAHSDGHGGTSWGEPALIDPAILANPILPGQTGPPPQRTKTPPKRPPRPAVEPEYPQPPKPPKMEDLLGSLDAELQERPVPRSMVDFSQMHAQIASTFTENVPDGPDLVRTRSDSFDTDTDEEYSAISRQYYQPPHESSACFTQESYESVYEVTPAGHDQLNTNYAKTEPISIKEINSISHPYSVHGAPVSPSVAFPDARNSPVNIGNNPFQMSAFNPQLQPRSTQVQFNPPQVPRGRNTAPAMANINPFITPSVAQPVSRAFHMDPLSPVKRSLTPEPSRSKQIPSGRSLTPNPEKTNGTYFSFNTAPVKPPVKELRKMSLPVNEAHFSDLKTQAFDWFKKPEENGAIQEEKYISSSTQSSISTERKGPNPQILSTNNTMNTEIQPTKVRLGNPKVEVKLEAPQLSQPTRVSLPAKKSPRFIDPPVPPIVQAPMQSSNATGGGVFPDNPVLGAEWGTVPSPTKPSPRRTSSLPKSSRLGPTPMAPETPVQNNKTSQPVKPTSIPRSTTSQINNTKSPVEPNIAFMSSNDAVEALRKKYGLAPAEQPKVAGSSLGASVDIFSTTKKLTNLEIKQKEMQLATLIKQCPGSTPSLAEKALKDHSYNMPKALKALKVNFYKCIFAYHF